MLLCGAVFASCSVVAGQSARCADSGERRLVDARPAWWQQTLAVPKHVMNVMTLPLEQGVNWLERNDVSARVGDIIAGPREEPPAAAPSWITFAPPRAVDGACGSGDRAGRLEQARQVAAAQSAPAVRLGTPSRSSVTWCDNDDQPIREPELDESGDYIWWDGTRNMTFYQLGKLLDIPGLARRMANAVGLVGPRESANVNALDEVPDSTWFTNRHGLRRMSLDELARGPNLGPPPSPDGPLIVLSSKGLGQSVGFHVKDAAGQRWVMKFDGALVSEMSTGTEMIVSKILHAGGWNVPEYHLVFIEPERLVLAPDAWTKDRYNPKRPMTREDLVHMLAQVAHRPDGRIRAIASRYIPGEAKGPFRTVGTRPDDPNDTVPHEDRRELRGLRIIAAWVNYTDARRGNFYDSFVRASDDPHGCGRLVHYLLDFGNALGSGNVDTKEPERGYEYAFDPIVTFKRVVTLGFWTPPWSERPLTHYLLGYFTDLHFDPERWRPSYPQPLFDRATIRDELWGAKLVASFSDDDLDAVVGTAQWSNPEAERILSRLLRSRRDRIAATYFRTDRINPADRFAIRSSFGCRPPIAEPGAEINAIGPGRQPCRAEVRAGARACCGAARTGSELRLEYSDLAVQSRVASPETSVYRYRHDGRTGWQQSRATSVPLPEELPLRLDLQTSHDAGATWSPSTRVTVDLRPDGCIEVVQIERETA